MDWVTYKSLCDRPDYWSGWMLEQSELLLSQLDEQRLVLALRESRAEQPLDVPDGFQGPHHARMYHLSLPPIIRAEVSYAIQQAVEQGLTTPDTADRGLGGFAEAWREFAEHRS